MFEYFPDLNIYTMADGKEALLSPKMNLSKYHREIEPFVLKNIKNIVLLDGLQRFNLSDSLVLQIIPTPGHDVTSVSYVLNNYLFTGDSYIPNSKLVCSFPRSNRKIAKANELFLKEMEKQGYQIMPGHYIE
jgi:glyoxylase-like metal-dependent hydrolase (beta-lactamase superfamily II)